MTMPTMVVLLMTQELCSNNLQGNGVSGLSEVCGKVDCLRFLGLAGKNG